MLRTSLSLYVNGRGRSDDRRLGGQVGLALDPRAQRGRGLERHGPHGEGGRQDDGAAGALPALRRVPALLHAVLSPPFADDVLHLGVEEAVKHRYKHALWEEKVRNVILLLQDLQQSQRTPARSSWHGCDTCDPPSALHISINIALTTARNDCVTRPAGTKRSGC